MSKKVMYELTLPEGRQPGQGRVTLKSDRARVVFDRTEKGDDGKVRIKKGDLSVTKALLPEDAALFAKEGIRVAETSYELKTPPKDYLEQKPDGPSADAARAAMETANQPAKGKSKKGGS